LAAAAQVTESYISQLLTRRKSPPAPDRADIYAKIEGFLKLPNGELAKLAELQHHEELKRKLADPLCHCSKKFENRSFANASRANKNK